MKLYKSLFEKTAKKAVGKAKGITPAFRNSDGSSGPDFIELKMRALLVENLRYRLSVNSENEIFKGDAETKKTNALYPMFQMTSVYNDEEIRDRIEEYRNSPMLKGLLDITGVEITEILTGVQPMLAAYTHSRVGRPKQIFTNAFGRNGEMLPVPGGHGQNFQIMSRIYRYMFEELNKKFIYLSNVDNIGNMPDPVSIALTAISGVQASFEFAFRTPVDTKGGILITDQRGRLNCADIGPAVSREEVDRQEAGGKKILYNCAIGLFNLEHLTENLDNIISGLPMRFTDQEKDAGAYSQAEQVTWEILGLLDDILILGVNKFDRYLAAKLLLESFMTSGLMIDSEKYPSHPDPSLDFKSTAEQLYSGLRRNLAGTYFMDMKDSRWQPIKTDRIVERINHEN
jgi:UDP-N-acetylglucosamine pyrophosphorylase